MGREPCCSKEGLHRGPWSSKEDMLLTNYIQSHGEGQWRSLPKRAGLLRCGKSCRLRWLNYLRPGIKRGNITPDEEDLIIRLQSLLGNRWSLIAGRLPGRTDNEIKNHWNTHILKRLKEQGIQPKSHKHIAKRRRSIPERKSKKANNESKLEKQNDSDDPEKEEEKHELPIVGKVYFPKPIRISSSFTANSYNVSAGTDSQGSVGSSSQHEQQQQQQEEEVDKIPWSSFDLGDDHTSYYFDDQSICNYENETFLIDYDFTLQDDDTLLKKVYDEYLQLL